MHSYLNESKEIANRTRRTQVKLGGFSYLTNPDSNLIKMKRAELTNRDGFDLTTAVTEVRLTNCHNKLYKSAKPVCSLFNPHISMNTS